MKVNVESRNLTFKLGKETGRIIFVRANEELTELYIDYIPHKYPQLKLTITLPWYAELFVRIMKTISTPNSTITIE